MSRRRVIESKFLSLLLRHKPDEIGLRLDAAGWASIDEIVQLTAKRRTPLSRAVIEEITATSEKQRFIISDDRQRIRANQGHSLPVDLGLAARKPPEILYHGTTTRFLHAILEQGLLKGTRQHVHLSPDIATALNVGRRHGEPAILSIASGRMHRDGFSFYLSQNGVWLTDHVPIRYIDTERANA
jgi:putative RNA 2'-phosphotransferase